MSIYESDKEIWDQVHSTGDYFNQSVPLEECLNNPSFSDYFFKKQGIKRKTVNQKVVEPFFDIDNTDMSEFDILEIGCGLGRLGMPFVKKGIKSYTGVDISQRIVNEGNDVIKKNGVTNAKLFCVTEKLLDIFPNNSFDYIYTDNVFIHCHPELTRIYLKQHASKLKPNGTFNHSFNINYNGPGGHSGTTQDYSMDEIDELFKNIGLKTLKTIDEDNYYAPQKRGIHIFGCKE